MARLSWQQGYGHYGTKQGVLFVRDDATVTDAPGVAWSGLTEVEWTYDGGDVEATAADDVAAWFSTTGALSLTPTISAVNYPDEFQAVLGEALLDATGGAYVDLQAKSSFDFAFITTREDRHTHTKKGDIVIFYNMVASPADKDFTTGSEDLIEFAFDATSSPIEFTGLDTFTHTTSSMVIPADDPKYPAVYDLIFGTEAETSKLVTPDMYLALV
jgi:hypothetical protein